MLTYLAHDKTLLRIAWAGKWREAGGRTQSFFRGIRSQGLQDGFGY